MFFPVVLLLALPWVLALQSDRVFCYAMLYRAMPDVIVWLSVCTLLGVINGTLRLTVDLSKTMEKKALEWQVMTQTQQDLLTKAYAAFNARDIDAVLAAMHPDVEWANGIEGGHVHGHEAVRDYWTRQWKLINPLVEPTGFQPDESGRMVVAEQLDYLKQRHQMLGEERIRQVEADWQELIAQARSAMQNGIDPTSEAVQELARRSQALIQEFTGGDAGIERSRLPNVPTRRSRSCQSRSDGFSRDGIYEQSKSRPESIRVANIKFPLAPKAKCTQLCQW